ncbi:glycosyltransferase [Austwickia chelonae]|uniref:glycosyltransferase n=1 Tax=Austwickia chelonae TaxID=100225 RepID=UPI000E23A38E|nr:glycosyltransferase [Austwickia chelonae]
MKVWVVAGEYPTPAHPGHGTFVADQVAALTAAGHQVRVIESLPPSLRPLANKAKPAARAVLSKVPKPKRHPRPRRGRARRMPVKAAVTALPAASTLPGQARRKLRPVPLKGAAASAARSATGAGRIVHDAVGTKVAVARMISQMKALMAREGKPDIIHAHNVFPAGVATERFAQDNYIPFIMTEHMTAYLRGQYSAGELALAGWVLDHSWWVVAVSSTQAKALPVSKERVTVVPNVVAVDDFRLRDVQAHARGPVVCIGKLTPHKRMDLMMRAYAELPEEVRAAHSLRIIGSGPDQARLTGIALSLGLGSGVLVGQRSRSQIIEEMAGAALLVSTSEVETFGVTMIEALAAGVPFVATDSGGPRDIWQPGLGHLVESTDPTEVARVIEEALTSPADRSADEARRASAVSRFGPTAIASSLEKIYRSALP